MKLYNYIKEHFKVTITYFLMTERQKKEINNALIACLSESGAFLLFPKYLPKENTHHRYF